MPPFRLSPCPRGPRSSPGYSVPVHQHLIDPIRATGRHIPTSRLCGYTKRLSCAGAPRPPTSGSELSLLNPFRHVAFFDSGEISDCIHPVPSPLTRPSHSTKTLGFPSNPTNPFRVGGMISELHYGSLALQPADLFALLTDQTQLSPCLRGLLLPVFHQSCHQTLTLDMATVATGQSPRVGLSLTGSAASFAALVLALPFRVA